MASSTPLPSYCISGERHGTLRAWVWLGPKVGLDAMEVSFLPLAGNEVQFLGLHPIAPSQYPLRRLGVDLDGRIILKWRVWIGFIWLIIRVSGWILGRRNERLGSIKTVSLLTARRLTDFVNGLCLLELLLSVILVVQDHGMRMFWNVQKRICYCGIAPVVNLNEPSCIKWTVCHLL